MACSDGKLISELFNTEGNKFATSYYETGDYFEDYADVFNESEEELPTIYHVENTWINYEKIKTRLDFRLKEWTESMNK